MGIFKNMKLKDLKAKGNRLLMKGKAEEAIIIYDKIIAIDNSIVSAYYNKQAGYNMLGKYDQALLCIDKVIELDPDKAAFYYQKAEILTLIEPKRYEEAISLYDMVIKLQPKNSEAYLRKGLTLVFLDKYDEAEVCYDKVIELTPKEYSVYSNKAVLLIKKKMYVEALELCNKTIQGNSKTKIGLEFSYFTKSRIYAMMDKKKECINSLSEAIKINASIKDSVHLCNEFDNIKNDKDFIKTIE